MNDFDDFDIGPQCDEYGDDDYPYDDDEDFCGMPPTYASLFIDDDMPF